MAEHAWRAGLGRRGFLKGAALSGAALGGAAASPSVGMTQPVAAVPAAVAPSLPRPTAPVPRAEDTSHREEGLTYSSCGGDYMVDVLRSLGIEYFAATPGNTFMG